MSYVTAWVFVSAMCVSGKPRICTTYTHASYDTESECREVVRKQNGYWEKTNLKATSYCIKSSIGPELSK